MKFKVGDRVAVYGAVELNSDRDQHRYIRGEYGTVDHIVGHDEINVALDSSRLVTVHPKQCRKLVKKERRRIWVLYDNHTPYIVTQNGPLDGWVEFVEVRKKK